MVIKKHEKMKSMLFLLIIIVTISGFFWLASFLGAGENIKSEKPLVICQPQNATPEQQKCFWTAHIHNSVKVFKGNEEIQIGFEQGELKGVHTHAEKNKFHWHGLLPVDPKTREVIDWSSLYVGNIPRDLKFSTEGTPMFIVNGKEVNRFYIWQDGDVIEILYP